MTEQGWLDAGAPGPLLAFLDGEAVTLVDRVPPRRREAVRRHLLLLATGRKKRLLACAFARQVWPLLADGRSRHAVEAAERFADGLGDQAELWAVIEAATQARDAIRVRERDGDRAPALAA